MSRWWMLGAVLPLVAGCGGGSSSTDDRERFGVTYIDPVSAETDADTGLPLFRRFDILCVGTKTDNNNTPDDDTDDTATAINVDLAMTAAVISFRAVWVNNELNDQDVELIGDGFRLNIYEIDSPGGSRVGEAIWHSDMDFSDVNEANGNDATVRYFESLESSGFDYDRVEATDETPIDSTIYKCDDNWQVTSVAAVVEDSDNKADPYQFPHSGGDAIGINGSVGGDVEVGDDQGYIITIPQSDTLPGSDTVGYRGANTIGAAGTYFWWGLDENGNGVDVDKTYEAELEVRICPVGSVCDDLKHAFQFKLADKVQN